MIRRKVIDLLMRFAWQRLAPFDMQENIAVVSDSFLSGKYHFKVRPYEAGDIEEILCLVRRALVEENTYSRSNSPNEKFLAKLKENAALIRAAFSILADGKICGFIRYCTWTNILLQQRNFENLVIYVAPEYRSYTLFKRICSLLELAASDVSADQILLSFDNGIAVEEKRRASERLGYETIGAFLGRVLPPSQKFRLSPGKRFPIFLRSANYLRSFSQLSIPNFVLYILTSFTVIRKKMDAGVAFFEYSDSSGSLAFAKTLYRPYDQHLIALVTIIHKPNRRMMCRLHNWATAKGCAEVVINTKEIGINPCEIFTDYDAYGYFVKGYILRKKARRISVEKRSESTKKVGDESTV